MAKHKKKKKIGRPTKYKEEYCQTLIKFFDVEPYEDRELPHYGKDGNVKWIDYKRMANKFPTLRNFAKKIKVDVTTPYEWIKKHKEFSQAFTQAKDLQKWFLIENGLNGCYNPIFAKFVAINISDMRDKVETDITSKGKEIKGFNFIQPNDSNNKTDNKTKPSVEKT